MRHFNGSDAKRRNNEFLLEREIYERTINTELGLNRGVNCGKDICINCTSINITTGLPLYIEFTTYSKSQKALNERVARDNKIKNYLAHNQIELDQQKKEQDLLRTGAYINYDNMVLDYYDLEDLFEL